MEPIKSGVKTTEFYLTLLAQFLGVGVTLALLTGGEAQEIVAATGSLVAAATAWLVAMTPLFAALGVLVKYISARTQLKIGVGGVFSGKK